MSENQAQNIQSNTADVPSDPIADNGRRTKPVDIDAPYEHALPKDGDPWTTLLTPELEADTLRCNAWKDEVQNLLIFAGLFSAVVTTFVVESYKLLLPDPNAAITGLLFHIASGLNNTSPFPPSVSPGSILTPFSRTPSAIRINVFWFISLILSLTTVLVGTIALQWLREHQSYSGYSSKEKLAMLHMRSEAIEAWYLPKVFSTLPLLLQAALVLFLAGLIDFCSPLGTKLMIPVSIIVGLTLLFLVATTILPPLQGLSFFCGLYPRKSLPTPCPFKSPQSHAFRTLFAIIVRVIFYICPSSQADFDTSAADSDGWKWIIQNRSLLIPDHLAPSVHNLWNQHTWPTLDREWLSLRDACHQRIFDDDPYLYLHRTCWEDSFPLSDVTRYLVEVACQTPGFKHTDSFLAALVHCFNELAESIWITTDELFFNLVQRKDRRNNYFEHLYSPFSKSCSLSNLFLHGGIYKLDQLTEDNLSYYIKRPEVKPRLFSTDQTMIFLCILMRYHRSPAILQCHRELWVRVLYLIGNIAPLTPIVTDGSEPTPIPTIIEWSVVYSMIDNNLTPSQQFLTMANILTTLFQLAVSHRGSQDRTIENFLSHPEMAEVLDTLAFRTKEYLEWGQVDPLTKQDVLRDIDDQLTQLVKFINDYLNEEQSNTSSSSQNASLDVLFYLTSIFSWNLLYWLTPRKILGNQNSHFGQALRSLLVALYKMWTSGQKNDLLEKRFRGDDRDDRHQIFSDQWWYQIFEHIGHRMIEQDPDPDTSSELAIPREDDTEDTTGTSPLSATSPGNLIRSPALHMHGTDDQLATTHPNLQPEISGDEHALSLVNHAITTISHSPSSLPDILNQPSMSIEGADTVNDLPLSHSRSLSNEPDETRPSGDDHTAAGAAPPSISQPLPSPSAADPDGVVPQQAAGNSRSDEHDLQSDGLHLAIDVGPPTRSEHMVAETLGAGGDRLLDEAEPEGEVIRMESPI